MTEGVADWVARCQTYEGGFGGEPFNEAHGGYNFCALATLLILNDFEKCQIANQRHWLVERQMKFEGGFQGRTNKLVDSCYSFWQGAACALINIINDKSSNRTCIDVEDALVYLNDNANDDYQSNSHLFNVFQYTPIVKENSNDNIDDLVINVDDLNTSNVRMSKVSNVSGPLCCNQLALQRYLIHCAQGETGGLRDKPGKSRDYYHTCYALSGLSISQRTSAKPNLNVNSVYCSENFIESFQTLQNIQFYGNVENVINMTSPVFNIGISKLANALKYFYSQGLPNTHDELMQGFHSKK